MFQIGDLVTLESFSKNHDDNKYIGVIVEIAAIKHRSTNFLYHVNWFDGIKSAEIAKHIVKVS